MILPNWSNIKNEIQRAGYEMNSPYNDGFNTWPLKQELYKIKWLVDELLQNGPKYSIEDDWLNEQEKEKIVKILKK